MPKLPRPVYAYAALDYLGRIMPNSVGDTRANVRLKAGECTPVPVMILLVAEWE